LHLDIEQNAFAVGWDGEEGKFDQREHRFCEPQARVAEIDLRNIQKDFEASLEPDVGIVRFAARPVGAASKQRSPFARATVRSPRNVWVLPVPGPPVRIDVGSVSAIRIALSCSAESAIWWR